MAFLKMDMNLGALLSGQRKGGVSIPTCTDVDIDGVG